MDIVYVLIGFVCGFICREVIWQTQMRLAKKRFEEFMEDMKPQMEKIRMDMEKFKQLEEKQNGDNQ